MTKNASHIVIHNYGNVSDPNLLTMVCCIVLSVAIVLILLVFIGFVIYVVSYKEKCKQDRPTSYDFSETLQNSSRVASNNYKRDVPSRRSEAVPNLPFENVSLDSNSNVQRIPLSTFKTEAEGNRANSSTSSAGLCDVLFPPEHEGEVIFEPPPKLVTYAGRVYATPRPNSQTASNPKPGTSGYVARSRKSDNVNASLEWDYFESRRYVASSASDGSEIDRKKTLEVSWV